MANTVEDTGIDGIGHIGLRVKDMEKSLDFYCKLLGLQKAFTIENDEGKPWIEYIKICDGQFLELFYPRPEDPQGPQAQATNNHICLAVEDIHETGRTLEAAGIELIIPVKGREGGNWQCWCRDPDGNFIEFMYIHPSSFQATA